jgi:hypothetical protein
MPYQRYHPASRTLRVLSLEGLSVAELAFCYGLPANQEVYDALKSAVAHLATDAFSWTWTHLNRDGFDLVVK